MATNEKDLNSEELISALKNIEMETVNVIEMEYLRNENQRLRNDLVERHQIRLMEIHQMESKQMELMQKMNEIQQNQGEIFRLRSLMINVNRNLEEALDRILYQIHLSYGFVSEENAPLVIDGMNKLNKLVHNASKQLEFHTVPMEQFDQRFVNIKEKNSAEKDMNVILEEIRSFDFEPLNPVSIV